MTTTERDTRADHLAWCKSRAQRYVEQGDLINAFTSLVSDLRKHPETEDHAALELGMMLMSSSTGVTDTRYTTRRVTGAMTALAVGQHVLSRT